MLMVLAAMMKKKRFCQLNFNSSRLQVGLIHAGSKAIIIKSMYINHPS